MTKTPDTTTTKAKTTKAKPPTLTPTCHDDTITTIGLLSALEGCWTAIRARHPEIPAAVIILGSGSDARTGDLTKWGHFASLRWQHGTRQVPEVLVSGEGLKRTPAEILTTLLHEAAHALADARNIQDTSRQGRWHNKKFANHATELGLTPSHDSKFGWAACQLPDDTAASYEVELKALTDALSVYRHPEPVRTKERSTSSNGLSLECACGRKIRASRTVAEQGPITCGVCNTPFASDDLDEDEPEDGDTE
jgi:hypothetical protein